MTVSSLNNLISNQPSLLDYMDGGRLSSSGGSGNAALALLGNNGDAGLAGGDSISLSPAAQKLLAQINGTGSAGGSSSGVNGIVKSAQNFLTGFFTDNGVDVTKLSDEAKELVNGLQEMIAASGATGRDLSTDMREENYNNGTRKVYTLTGDERRIRMAVEYKDGKPQSLTLTAIEKTGDVTSAGITLTAGADGKATGIDVAQTVYKYNNGSLADSQTKPIMSLALYT